MLNRPVLCLDFGGKGIRCTFVVRILWRILMWIILLSSVRIIVFVNISSINNLIRSVKMVGLGFSYARALAQVIVMQCLRINCKFKKSSCLTLLII